MSRLFVSLFLCIVLALVGFFLAIEYLPDRLLGNSMRSFQKHTYQGTVYLLDEYIQSEDNETDAVKKLNSMFGYDVELVALADLDIDEKEIQRLALGEPSLDEIDGADYLYYPSAIMGKIWMLQVDQTETEDYQRGAMGTIRLIEQHLEAFDVQHWSQQVDNIAENFGFPIQLKSLSSLDLPEELKARVISGELIAQHYESSDEQYYSRLFESDYVIHAGPVKDIWFEKYLVYAIFGFLGMLISMAILIWVVPLWRSLSSLNNAANELGQGNFETRVESRGYAPIKKITESFNLMAEHIQGLVVSHKDLTNAVSHELRTPLARLRFGLEMMRDAEDDNRREYYFKEMNTDIEELEALVSELLTYARTERDSHSISYQPVKILSWLEEQSQRLSSLAKDKKLVTNFKAIDPQDEVQVEQKLMARALSNLVTNAIRHGQTVILISASIEHQQLQIVVDDDGGGISAEIGQTIFEPFKRGDISRDRDTGGFGLGLGIVKQVTDWHKGSVVLTDSDLGGARFVMTVPVNKAAT